MTRQKAPAQARLGSVLQPHRREGAQYRQARMGQRVARPADARSSDARLSFSRLAVWVARRETKISGEPSTSVATLTKDPNGWPVLRSMVPNAPARLARSR